MKEVANDGEFFEREQRNRKTWVTSMTMYSFMTTWPSNCHDEDLIP